MIVGGESPVEEERWELAGEVRATTALQTHVEVVPEVRVGSGSLSLGVYSGRVLDEIVARITRYNLSSCYPHFPLQEGGGKLVGGGGGGGG